MNRISLVLILSAIAMLPSGCGGSASQGSATSTVAEGSTSSAAPAAIAAATTERGVLTVGTASSSINASSPTKCPSPRTQFTEARTGVVKDTDGVPWTVPSVVTAGDTGTDLYNDCTSAGVNAPFESQLKTVVIDPDGVEITAYIHADNYFELFVNGSFVCRDPIAFTPFNSTACRFKAKYPLTYAIRAVDWEEHLGVGMEYDRMNVGDGGIVVHFSDGTVTDSGWKAEAFYFAPLDGGECVKVAANGTRDSSGCPVRPTCLGANPLLTCRGLHFAEPKNWASPDFDDSTWPSATEYTREQFGPKEAYTSIERLFTGAKFVWSRNLNIDNVVLLRRTVAGR